MISLQAKVAAVIQQENLTPQKVKELLTVYYRQLGITKGQLSLYHRMFKDKKYCIFVTLDDVKCITPFSINKKGFSPMSAWLTIPTIDEIKI